MEALTCLGSPDAPSLLIGDPGRPPRRIFVNLVGNAIKFTHVSKVVVRVLLEEEFDELATLRFEVRDTGVGAPPHRLKAKASKSSWIFGSLFGISSPLRTLMVEDTLTTKLLSGYASLTYDYDKVWTLVLF